MRGEGNHKIPGSFAPENMEKTGAERVKYSLACQHEDAIPIKVVSYAQKCPTVLCTFAVALRKESVDRNANPGSTMLTFPVALRKESVDRNGGLMSVVRFATVALRKESVDRNCRHPARCVGLLSSLSARRAWIEIFGGACARLLALSSLSARRAWIEIFGGACARLLALVALRKESVDRNLNSIKRFVMSVGRSPQGERG